MSIEWTFNPFTKKLDAIGLSISDLATLDARYLTLDQTTPQSVISGTPSFYDIKIPRMSLGSPTYSTQNDFNNSFGSCGRKTGGTISDAGSNYIAVTAGTGFIKATDDDNAQLMFFNWSAPANILIPNDSTRYIGVEYNGGNPQVVSRTSFNWNLDSEFPLGRVISENINGAQELYIYNSPWWVTDGITNVIEVIRSFGLVRRDESIGGLIVSQTGTRNIAVSSGTLWSGLSEFSFSGLDTAITGTFEYYWYKAGTGWQSSDAAQYSVTQWNDVTQTTLQTISLNKYCNVWIYGEFGAGTPSVAVIYPQAQYNTAAAAEAVAAPTNLPTHIKDVGKLLGRIIIKQGVDAPISVETVFTTTFANSVVTDHGNLSGLSDDDHTQYWIAGTARTGNFSTSGTLGAGAITGTSFIIGANTLDTNEWAYLDGQNQAVKTTSSPTFANLILTSGGDIRPSADGTTAFSFAKADGTNIASLDTTNSRLRLDGNSAVSSGTNDWIRLGKNVFQSNYAYEDAGLSMSVGDVPSGFFIESNGTRTQILEMAINTHHFTNRSTSYPGCAFHLDARGLYGRFHVYTYDNNGTEHEPIVIDENNIVGLDYTMVGHRTHASIAFDVHSTQNDSFDTLSLSGIANFQMPAPDRNRIFLGNIDESTANVSSAIHFWSVSKDGYLTPTSFWELGNDYTQDGSQTFYLYDSVNSKAIFNVTGDGTNPRFQFGVPIGIASYVGGTSQLYLFSNGSSPCISYSGVSYLSLGSSAPDTYTEYWRLSSTGIRGNGYGDTDLDLNETMRTYTYAGYGLLIVSVGTDSITGVFRIENQSIAIVSANALFTTTKDNASTYNVYWETNDFYVQNKVANNKSVKAMFYGFI